jgi:hypothetical protein
VRVFACRCRSGGGWPAVVSRRHPILQNGRFGGRLRSEEQLRHRFDAEIKGMTEDALLRFLEKEERASLGEADESKKREVLEELVWQSSQRPLILHGIQLIVLAAITDSIIRKRPANPPCRAW